MLSLGRLKYCELVSDPSELFSVGIQFQVMEVGYGVRVGAWADGTVWKFKFYNDDEINGTVNKVDGTVLMDNGTLARVKSDGQFTLAEGRYARKEPGV